MGVGAVVTSSGNEGYLQFVDPNRRWYNNSRLIKLHAWIVLLYVPATVLPPQSPLTTTLQPHHVLHERFRWFAHELLPIPHPLG